MFNANMKDQHGKTVIPPYRKTASLTSLCTDISPSSSHFFEVFRYCLLFVFRIVKNIFSKTNSYDRKFFF